MTLLLTNALLPTVKVEDVLYMSGKRNIVKEIDGPYFWLEDSTGYCYKKCLRYVDESFGYKLVRSENRKDRKPVSNVVKISLSEIDTLEIGDVLYRRGVRTVVTDVTAVAIVVKQPNEKIVLYLKRYLPNEDLKIVKAANVRKRKTSGTPKPKKIKLSNYPFVATLGGRSEYLPWERNDCTVRALTHSMDIPYMDAWKIMKNLGRVDGKGARTSIMYPKVSYNGMKLKKVSPSLLLGTKGAWETVTLGQVIASGKAPSKCIVQVNKHVFAMVNGVVKDSHKTGVRSHVHQIWEVVSE